MDIFYAYYINLNIYNVYKTVGTYKYLYSTFIKCQAGMSLWAVWVWL